MASEDEKASIRLNEVAGTSTENIADDKTDSNQNINKNGYEDLSTSDLGELRDCRGGILIFFLKSYSNIYPKCRKFGFWTLSCLKYLKNEEN